MKVRVLGLGSAVAAATVAMVLTASPGHAVTAGSIGVAGEWRSATSEQANPDSALLEFFNLVVLPAGTGFLAGYSPVSVGDLPLNRVTVLQDDANAVRAVYELDMSFTGERWKVYENDAGAQIVFNLNTDATWLRFFDRDDTDTSWAQWNKDVGLPGEFSGTYLLPDGTILAGTGILNASSAGQARTFEVTQQSSAIPLPATAWLLLGASAFLGYFGRRKGRAQLAAV